MSDKLDLILEKLESMDQRLQRNEDRTGQLLKIVGSTNKKISDVQSDIKRVEQKIDTGLEDLTDSVEILVEESHLNKREIKRLKKNTG